MTGVRALQPTAFSIGRQAYERIELAKWPGSVHSCYGGAINVQTGLGLVCLVPRGAGRGPLNINLDAEALARAGDMASGSPVDRSVKGLVFKNGFRLTLSNAEIFEPTGRFDSPALRPRKIERNISTARDIALLMGHLEGVGELLKAIGGSPSAPPMGPFSAAALPRVKRLLRAIGARDRGGAREVAKGLAGLGIGLTPAADDMLSGIMVSLVLGSLNGIGADDISEVVPWIADSCRGRTSDLSYEFLLQAASGRANERITRLVEAIYTGTASEVRTATLDTIAIGETSGTDAVTGVVLGAKTAIATAELAA